MGIYEISDSDLKLIEECSVPFAVYQFVDRRVYAIAISDGFRKLIDVETFEEARDLMTNNMYRDIHPDDAARVAEAALDFAVNEAEYDVIYRHMRGGKYRVIHSKGHHIYKDGVRLAEVSYTDEGEYSPEDMQDDSYFIHFSEKYFTDNSILYGYDYMTGLPDMNYFFELAESAHKVSIEAGYGLAMIFLDLNGMQGFNQTYGYEEGNVLIKATASLLAKIFNRENCCRITADHFAVFTEEDGLEDKINTFIEELKYINDGKTLPAKIGVYRSKFERVTAATATDRAKIACDNCGGTFESKVEYFDDNMLHIFQVKRYIFENFDRAIEEGWIQVYYQPIVRTSNGKVCSEEALARWIDPEKGLLPPVDFVPILEDVKAAYKLDLLVVDEVLKKLNKQKAAGLYTVPNSINLSRTDFYSCDIVEEIRKRVDKSGIDRSKLIIEVTESVIMEDMNFMMTQIERFKNYGFSVWLDDFGSGYSSPDILQKINFDVVKIDKAFIDSIDRSEDSKVIITELLRLSGGLGCETVAEGVETISQVEFLNEVGCTRIQGYYYCKPIPLEEILNRYKRGVQIGFENPNESEYYETLGNVNLYDMSIASDEDDESLSNYFDTMPMFIIEVGEVKVKLVRGNKSFREFMARRYPELKDVESDDFSRIKKAVNGKFLDAIHKCIETGKPALIEARNRNNGIANLFIRRIATNPETGVVALAIIVLAYNDDDSEIRHKEALVRIEQERMTYKRITALAGDFVCIYTVDPQKEYYIQHVLNDRYKRFKLSEKGEKFFKQARQNGRENICEEDQELFLSSFTKRNVMKEIENNGMYSLTVRFVIDGEYWHNNIRVTMLREDDGYRLVVGLLDIEEQVRREQEYSAKLTAAQNDANRDALTGVKNKHAYVDTEMRLNSQIEEGENPEFAVTVFDLNGLKEINDTMGHQEGDKYIKEGCRYICDIFKHSPVFRVGGDEFVVISQGEDYKNIAKLVKKFDQLNVKNSEDNKVVVAVGSAKYDGERNVAAVFNRADKYMYENKKLLKGID